MSELIKKSKENLKSADILISKGKCWSSSIHCSYYGCLQIILHLINNTAYKKDWEEYKRKAQEQAKDSDNEQSLHALYIGFLQTALLNDDNPKGGDIARNFASGIDMIRRHRNNADYHEKEITEDNASKSYDKATSIIKDLNAFFKL